MTGRFLCVPKEIGAKNIPDGATFPATHPAPPGKPGAHFPVRPFAAARLTPALRAFAIRSLDSTSLCWRVTRRYPAPLRLAAKGFVMCQDAITRGRTTAGMPGGATLRAVAEGCAGAADVGASYGAQPQKPWQRYAFRPVGEPNPRKSRSRTQRGAGGKPARAHPVQGGSAPVPGQTLFRQWAQAAGMNGVAWRR